MNKDQLQSFFNPENIAVIGASARQGKIGHSVLQNLLQAGYQGSIYPVNPKAEEIMGLPVYKDIQDLPQYLDLAVITIPRDAVLPCLQELAGIQVQAAIIISAGFKETGKSGYYLEQEIMDLASEHGIAILGPNCLGMINTHARLNATFAAGIPAQGNIAFFSQSGALCQAILDWSLGENIGFSKFVSLGNKAVLNEAHMLEFLGQDQETDVILGYIENVNNGREFMRQAQVISRHKPVLIIKSGTSAAGAKAASSHTGAIAGADQAYQAAFEQSGILRVKDVQTLFSLAQAFASQPLPQGPNLAVLTNSGGPGIMAADACEGTSLNMAKLNPDTVQAMQEFLPSFAALHNPVDIIGDATAKRYQDTLRVLVQDPNVDAVLVLLTPTASIKEEIQETAKGIIDVTQNCSKPIFACFMGKQAVAPGQKLLQEHKIPCYNYPEPAIQGLDSMFKYLQWQHRTWKEEDKIQVDKLRAKQELDRIKSCSSRRPLEVVEFQAQEILQAYDLPVPRTELAATSTQALQKAQKVGFPLVLKIASEDISHKSDVGGVIVGIKSPEELQKAFTELTSRARSLRPEAYLSGCLLQEMAPKGAKEIIVGFKRDEQFGPLLMFGLGGIYVEVLKDISFKLAPLNRNDAQDMIRNIRSYMLLKGVRGETAVDLGAIEDIILKMSQLSMDFPELLEAELNPVLVNEQRALVADVRMLLDENQAF
ncbi:MAG: acetate--CoA ligase family protein [Desulfohalobiaceae bacterium]